MGGMVKTSPARFYHRRFARAHAGRSPRSRGIGEGRAEARPRPVRRGCSRHRPYRRHPGPRGAAHRSRPDRRNQHGIDHRRALRRRMVARRDGGDRPGDRLGKYLHRSCRSQGQIVSAQTGRSAGADRRPALLRGHQAGGAVRRHQRSATRARAADHRGALGGRNRFRSASDPLSRGSRRHRDR